MKIKILFIISVGFFLASCSKKEEVKEIKIPIKTQEVQIENKKSPSIITVVEEVNPLSEYISDKVYNEGVKIFYGDERNMFSEDTDVFSGNQEKLKANIEARFKLAMLVTQSGVNSAVIYYLENGSKNRVIINGFKIIEIEKIVYYIKIFKDRIEIKEGKNGRSVPLYLRER